MTKVIAAERHAPPYCGRFAPSPTGPLHFGSLVAALGSWLDARAAGGRWLVRIEDVDRPRTVHGAAETILHALGELGLVWDGAPVVQSRRDDAYCAAMRQLVAGGNAYGCACSRREVAARGRPGLDGPVYDGRCFLAPPGAQDLRATRFRVPTGSIRFEDRIQGVVCQDLAQECGDFVIHRADGLFAYQLAVVVDDAETGVTQVVRGADLLDSTPRQMALLEALGLPLPVYAHLPLAVDSDGKKLSKQDGARNVMAMSPHRALQQALAFLGQLPAEGDSVQAVLDQAIAQWQPGRIPARRTQPAMPL